MNKNMQVLFKRLERDSEFVFPSPRTGKRLFDIKGGFLRAAKKAGLEDFRFHDLRHTAATRMADSGADGFTLAAILGHSDIRMTARYTHATNEAIRNEVTKLDFGNELVTN